jgi:hypothetical protein
MSEKRETWCLPNYPLLNYPNLLLLLRVKTKKPEPQELQGRASRPDPVTMAAVSRCRPAPASGSSRGR